MLVARAAPAGRSLLRGSATASCTGLQTLRAVATRAAGAMEKVTFGDGLPGYEAGPKAAPGVVVLQEWWGVTDIIKDQALLISKEGFRVLIPDLYKGKVGVDAEEASHLMNHLDFKAAVSEVKAAADYLRGSGAAKVGVVGFCMGGALSFAAAQHAGVDCAAPFYGVADPAICQPPSIKVPVQAHFGALDSLQGFSDPDTIAKVVDAMKAAGCPVQLYMYPGCGHAFMNALTESGREKIKTIGQASPPEAEVKEAFDRLIAFLKQHLA